MGDSVDELMRGFALRTGLEGEAAASRRYLWTDAFAVCNWLGRFVEKGDEQALRLALRLVGETHRVLGQRRPDDPRRGWISGLDDKEGVRHPTVGGLRIGKALPERPIGEPYDPNQEWDRDGQYYHYLTKWMQALMNCSQVTTDRTYRHWATELARTAHAHFAVTDSAGRAIGLHWKMSVDLSRALVPSMGQHDPLDGFITCSRLQAEAGSETEGDLSREIRELAQMCRGRDWVTEDPLGIGGLLTDAHFLARLTDSGNGEERLDLLESILKASVAGLETVVRRRLFDLPAEHRLAFRELGLSIGLRATDRLLARADEEGAFSKRPGIRSALAYLVRFRGLGSTIEEFWLEPENRRGTHWSAHQDINDVMLATSLAPRGFLDLIGGESFGAP